MYDFDGDQKIGRDDLKELLSSLVPKGTDGADSELLEHIVDRTLEEADFDGDGGLNFDEFSRAVAHSDIASKLTISF